MTGGQAVLALPAAVHPTARTCDNVHGRVQIGTEGDAPQHARNMVVHFGVPDAPQPVSYTHLTLPTTYSV